MKKILIVLIFLSYVFEGSAQTQLLENGDFEQGAAGYWMSGISPGSQGPIVTDEDGNKHYSSYVEYADQAWTVNTSQFVALVQGETYTLMFEAWSNVDRSIVAGLGLSCLLYTSDAADE